MMTMAIVMASASVSPAATVGVKTVPAVALVVAAGAAFGYGTQAITPPVNFTLHPGDRLVLTGRNGAGKSTLLRGLLGQAAVVAGQLTIAPGLRLALVPQLEPPDAVMPTTIGEALRIATPPGFSASDRDRLLAQFDLTSLLSLPLRHASGGQRQRVWLVRALLQSPKVLLLDEPTTGLDREGQRQVHEALNALPDSIAVVLVTHDPALIGQYDTHLLSLDASPLERLQ